MDHRSMNRVHAPILLGCLLAACSDGGTVRNAAPRLTEVPEQSATGASVFQLDLGDYVSDREGATLTYSVQSGGGSFGGSVYSHTFDTMGEFDVSFAVNDGARTETGTFRVRVTSADYAVATEDSTALLLLDAGTVKTLQVTSATQSPQFVASLAGGRMAYKHGIVSQLWMFDPLTRLNSQLGEGLGAATYAAKTSDGRLVYKTGSSTDLTLWYFNPRTGFTRELGKGALTTTDVLVNSNDLIFHETEDEGQADIYYFDPSTNESVLVSDASTNEDLQAVLDNGACVFSRVGSGGETDLFYFRVGTGLVEIGADQSALATRNKTYQASASDGRVVFTALNAGDEELFAWNPANGVTTTIAAANTTVFGVGAGNEVVYNVVVSTTEEDAFFYDLDEVTGAVTLRNSSDKSVISAVVDGGSTRWAIVRGSGSTSDKLAISLVASPSTQTWSAGGVVSTQAVLANGDVVAQRQDGTAINIFDASAGTWGTPITGTGLDAKNEGMDDGDFVYEVEVSSQTDIMMWDASATTSVVVSNSTDDDRWEDVTAGGKVVFARKVGTNTTWDLYVWDGTTATRATDEDADGVFHDHSVTGVYAASR